jgi:mannose-6-phosphate isomerase-like protein (cupin superfamily)
MRSKTQEKFVSVSKIVTKLTARALVLGAMAVASAALAQAPPAGGGARPAAAPPPPPETTAAKILSSKEVTDAGVAGRAASAAPMVSTNLFAQAPYRGNVEHRVAGTTPPSIHLRNGELFFVTDGSGTIVSGGELENPTVRGGNVNGTAIKGGVSRVVNKGDVIFIPAGLPHQVADVKTTLTMVSVFLSNVTTPVAVPNMPAAPAQ